MTNSPGWVERRANHGSEEYAGQLHACADYTVQNHVIALGKAKIKV